MSARNEWIRWAAACRLGILVAALVASVGCSATGPPEHRADVILQVDSETYRRGQPVQATVRVTNHDDVDLLVPALDNSALKFRWGQPGAGQPLVRRPVLPENAVGTPRVIPPGESASRTFLFTGLTGESGEWGLMVGVYSCRSAGAEDFPLPAYYSTPAVFTVSDELMFERDPYSGIIVRGQAIALARKRGGVDESVPAGAVLMPVGDTGLYRWIVLLGAEDDLMEARAAFTVNAYSGVVKAFEVSDPSHERTEE
jgi:hypothetical protein